MSSAIHKLYSGDTVFLLIKIHQLPVYDRFIVNFLFNKELVNFAAYFSFKRNRQF